MQRAEQRLSCEVTHIKKGNKSNSSCHNSRIIRDHHMLKTSNRSRMMEGTLDDLMLLCQEGPKREKFNFDRAICIWSGRKNRRINVLWINDVLKTIAFRFYWKIIYKMLKLYKYVRRRMPPTTASCSVQRFELHPSRSSPQVYFSPMENPGFHWRIYF